MAHFADANINRVAGQVASLKGTSVSQRLTTGNGATEGSDLLTFTTPNDGIVRRYMILAYVKIGTVSDAATTDVMKVQVSYNDGAAFTDVDLRPDGDAAVDTIDAKGTAAKGTWIGMVRCAANTSLSVYADHVVTGAKTAGTYAAIDFVIIALD